MKKLSAQALIACMMLLAFGCKKSGSGNNFTVNNQNGTTKMQIDIYTSATDYMNGTNVYIHGTATAGGTFSFPTSKLTIGNWYYVDAYSDDYTVTNWVNGDNVLIGQDSTTPLRFKYGTGANNNYFMILSQQTNSRISLLKNNTPTTTWIAVDALDLSSNESIWYSLTPEQQNAKLVINKNHTGTFYYDSTGYHYYSNFTFTGGISGYPVFSLNADQTYLHVFVTNTTTNPITYQYSPTTIDTVMSLMAGYLYLLKRQ